MRKIYFKSRDLKTLTSQLMAYSDLTEEVAHAIALESMNEINRIPIPIQPKEQWPKLSEEEMQIINYRIDTIIAAVDQVYPMLEGEILTGEGYLSSYLSDSYLNYPAGTAVVRRQSSFGEVYFLETSFIFDGLRIHGTPYPVVAGLRKFSDLPKAGVFSWGDLAIDIGKSLAGAIFDKIGSGIFEQFFPAGVPSYFDKVYEQFEKIVNQSIAENKRKEMSAIVRSIQDGMLTYNRIKADPAKYIESQKILSDLWNESRILTNTIKEFKEVGLGLFAVAGGLHLVILQERALSDKDHANPNNSPWAADLIAKASEFANWGGNTRYEFIKKRGDAITEVVLVKQSTFIPGAGPVDSSYHFWEDKFTGEKFKYGARETICDRNPRHTARMARQQRWEETVVVMTNDLKPLEKCTFEWNKLTTQPIPLPK